MKNNFFLTLSILILFLIISYSNLYAQCEISTAQIDLESDNVITSFHTSGDFWWDGSQGKYLFPKPPGGNTEIAVSAIKVGGLWVGGFDSEGNIRVAAQTDGRSEGLTDYWPGPGISDEDCLNYDRFWKITDDEINAHKEDFLDNGVIDNPIPMSILAWPAYGNPNSLAVNGFEIPIGFFDFEDAPFEDENFDGLYNPADGDVPHINCASQAVWWTFNDFSGVHTQSGGAPVGIQATMLAYTYEDSGNENIENTTFYEMRIRNRSMEQIDSAYIGLWIDFDLGCPFDDLIGFDTLNDIAYAYNEDAVDGISDCSDCNGFNTYCEEVPMIGLQILRGPIGGKMFINGLDSSDGIRNPHIGETPDTLVQLGTSSFIYYNNGTNSPFPDLPIPSNGSPQDFYNLMTGSWPDGTRITQGGSGYNPGSTNYTNYVFPGNPDEPNGWSMCNENFAGSDRKMVLGFGPVMMLPQTFNQIFFSVIATENITYPCPSLAPLIEVANDAEFYAGQGLPSNVDGCSFFTSTEIVNNRPNDEVVFQPNPISMNQQGQLILKNDQESIETVDFFSYTGKHITSIKNINANSIQINSALIGPGMYFYLLKTNQSKLYSGKFIVQ